jgi:hypothetical protein
MQIHSVAKLFPEMTTKQFNELVNDIRKNGQIEAILTCSGKIADGFHRFKACSKLKIDPKIVRWEDIRPDKDASLVSYVISRNLKRRHMSQSQRAVIASKALPLFEEEAASRQKASTVKAGQASAAARRGEESTLRESEESTLRESNVPANLRERSTEASETKEVSLKKTKDRNQEAASQAAQQTGVSRRYVQEAAAIEKKSPAVHKLLEDGAIAIPLAKKLMTLAPDQLKHVLSEGKKTGDYKAALKESLSQSQPSSEAATPKALVRKFLRAISQVEALNTTLDDAIQMSHEVTIEKGQGLSKLLDLTKRAYDLTKQIAGE